VEAVSNAIQDGTLAAGAQLPPHRELAHALRLSVGTVSRAYAMARDRGLLTGTVGRGTFVAAAATRPEQDAGPINLTVNFLRWDAKDPVLQCLTGALRQAEGLQAVVEEYAESAGRMRHRAATAAWIERPEFHVGPDQVVITNGAQQGMYAVLSALSEPGELVAAECLTYPGLAAMARQLRLGIVPLPIDGQGALPDALDRACLKQKIKFLYLIPTLHNPTGVTMGIERRQELAAVARKHQVTILEDDVYGFLMSSPPPPVAAFAPELSYFITSMSKSVAPGLRIGFVACPPRRAPQIATWLHTTSIVISPVAAEIATAWLRGGTVARVIEAKRAEVAARWEMATRMLHLDPSDRHPAAHLWLPVPETWRVEDFQEQARARGVILARSESFSVEPDNKPRAVRVCLGAPATRDRLQQALGIITELLQAQPAPLQVI
jgi:DNA-binding transcriptional MocR family regulator